MISLKRLIVMFAAVAAVVLAVVVLVAHPADTVDLLAGAGIAAAVGLLAEDA